MGMMARELEIRDFERNITTWGLEITVSVEK